MNLCCFSWYDQLQHDLQSSKHQSTQLAIIKKRLRIVPVLVAIVALAIFVVVALVDVCFSFFAVDAHYIFHIFPLIVYIQNSVLLDLS